MAIISTKLFAPRPGNTPIQRHSLNAQLDQGLDQPLTLVCAPAGYGKSQLLANWVTDCGAPHGWVQLEMADSNPNRFLTYVTAALRNAEPNAMAQTWGFLQGSHAVDHDALCLTFVNEACELTANTVIVLDDYHCIESTQCDALLAQLINYSPVQLHWYIATREDPGLPLAKWRMRGNFTELRARNLLFSPAETHAFCNHSMGLTLRSDTTAALCERTEGWAAALQLAALSLKNQPEPEEKVTAFAGSNRFITDYLLAEVFANISQPLQQFIASTVHLTRFNAALCAAVTGDHNAQQHLVQLEQNNIFLVALDDERNWYRYHHLFADAVSVTHGHLGVGKQQALFTAALWYDEQKQSVEAIECALQTDDYELLAKLIELHWPTLREQYPDHTFLQWMQALPHDTIEQRPVLCAYYGLALLSDQFELGQHFLQTAQYKNENRFIHNQRALASVPGILSIGQSYISGAIGDLSATIEHAQHALTVLPPNDHVWRGAAFALLGIQYWCTGQLPQAIDTLRQANTQMLATGDLSAQLSIRYLLACVLLTFGRLREATRELDEALNRIEQLQGAYPQGSADIMVARAECHLEANQLDAARMLLERAENLGPAAQLAESKHRLPLMRAELAFALGQYSSAQAELDIAEASQSHSPTPELTAIPSLRALYAIRNNKSGEIDCWAKHREKSIAEPVDFSNAVDLWILSLYYLNTAALPSNTSQAHYQKAQAILDKLWPWAHASDCQGFCIDVLIAKADLAYALNQKRLAQSALEQAMGIAQGQGYLRNILVCHALPKLLPEIQAKVYPEIHRQLMAAMQDTQSKSFNQLTEPLSERETQVLKLLDTALTGPEIADTLFVSLNTFRTHSKNIYSKLGVNSRRSAVAIARALALIDS